MTNTTNLVNLNPCLHCGACCSYYRVSFYSGELEGETGGLVPVDFTTQTGPLRACMKGTELGQGRCIALRGEIGKEGVHCAIYQNRPSPCRDFYVYDEKGLPNPECQKLRASINIPLLKPLPEPPDSYDKAA